MIGRERAAIIAVLSAMALVVLDAGMLNVALPVIAGALGETPAHVTLTITAYQTALVIGLLPCAQIAERVGYRRLFIAGTSTFLAASILCALAPSLAVLVAARIAQGLGGAAIMALGIALLRLSLAICGSFEIRFERGVEAVAPRQRLDAPPCLRPTIGQ